MFNSKETKALADIYEKMVSKAKEESEASTEVKADEEGKTEVDTKKGSDKKEPKRVDPAAKKPADDEEESDGKKKNPFEKNEAKALPRTLGNKPDKKFVYTVVRSSPGNKDTEETYNSLEDAKRVVMNMKKGAGIGTNIKIVKVPRTKLAGPKGKLPEETEFLEAKAKVTDKEDDGEGMDPVGAGDSDIDNDGDSDESDAYLKKRRKVISKNIKKESYSERAKLRESAMGEKIRAAAGESKMSEDEMEMFAARLGMSVADVQKYLDETDFSMAGDFKESVELDEGDDNENL